MAKRINSAKIKIEYQEAVQLEENATFEEAKQLFLDSLLQEGVGEVKIKVVFVDDEEVEFELVNQSTLDLDNNEGDEVGAIANDEEDEEENDLAEEDNDDDDDDDDEEEDDDDDDDEEEDDDDDDDDEQSEIEEGEAGEEGE